MQSQLLLYFEYRNAGDSNHQWAADHYKFLGYELFLYATAALLRFQRFDQLNELTMQGYYSSSSYNYRNQNTLSTFSRFNTYSEALQDYNKRQQRQYYSIEAHFMNQRATKKDYKFEDLMQADFLLYLIYQIDEEQSTSKSYVSWYPVTLTFAEYRDRPFEVFLRSESQRFFNKFKICLRNASKESLSDLFEKFSKDRGRLFGRFRLDFPVFTGIEQISTRP